MKVGNEIESEKDLWVLFDFVFESLKKKLLLIGRLILVVKILEKCKYVKCRCKEVFSFFVFIYFNL